MPRPGPIRWLVLTAALAIGGVEVHSLTTHQLPAADGWFPLLLVILAAVILPFRRDIQIVAVLSLLLTALSAAWIFPPESPVWLSDFVTLIRISLVLLCPFLFVHFSLVFPIPNRWIESNPHRWALVYVPYLVLVSPSWWVVFQEQTGSLGNLIDDAALLIVLAGFAMGLSIFVYQYLFSLTSAERNRLRVILIGCLAGWIPYVVSLLGVPSESWASVASFLRPLFPLCLVFAVLHENFYEIGRVFQRGLVYSLVSAGAISVFYLSYATLRSETVLASSLLALVVIYPLYRWAGAYIASHFHRGPRRGAGRGPVPQFNPIDPNPYIVGNPVQSPEMFFGRKEDFQFIKTRLQSQHHGCVILLYGERRSGKTSILHQIVNGRLGSRFVPVFVDMQGMVVQSDAELLRALAGRVAGRLTAKESDGAISPAPVAGFLDFTSFMDNVIGQIGDRHLVVLIDEYELLEHKVNQGKISGEIFDYLTSLLERHPHRLSLIFTGSRGLESSNAWHSLLGKCVARKVSFLGPRDAEDLICTPLRGKVLFEPETIGDLLRLTRGAPFFTQLLCQMTVEVLNEQRTSMVDRPILSQVMERVLENPPPQLLYLWGKFTRSERLLLAALAALLNTPASYASSDRVDRTIQSLPREYREGLDATRSRMLLEGLRLGDILDRDQTRYRFTMDLMRRWIQLEHNVWNVLNELKQEPART